MKAKVEKTERGWTWNLVKDGKLIYETKKYFPNEHAAIRSMTRGAKNKMKELADAG